VTVPAAAVPWRRPLRRLALGVTTSALGDGVWIAAIGPLAATLTRSPVTISLVETAAGLPWLLFGLAGGVAADRWPRRTLLWAADLVRLGLAALLAALVAAGVASVPLLLAAVFALATAGTVADSAFPAFLPELVPAPALASANATLATGRSAGGMLAGPAVGAALFGWLAWSPFAVDAATFAISAVSLLSLGRTGSRAAAAPARPVGGGSAALAGLRFIGAHPVVRVLAAATILLSAATFLTVGLLVLFVRYELHLPGSAFGLLLCAYAVGAVGGGVLCRRPLRRLGLRRAAPLAAVLGAAAWAGVAASPGWWGAAGCLILLGVASTGWSVSETTLRQRVVPPALLGRVSAAMNLLGRGTAPLAAPAGGLLAHLLGLRAAVGTSALLCAVAAALLWFRLRRERAHDEGDNQASAR
jgi:MFS family permease